MALWLFQDISRHMAFDLLFLRDMPQAFVRQWFFWCRRRRRWWGPSRMATLPSCWFVPGCAMWLDLPRFRQEFYTLPDLTVSCGCFFDKITKETANKTVSFGNTYDYLLFMYAFFSSLSCTSKQRP